MKSNLQTVDIICPLYNGQSYIKRLHASFLMQKNVSLNLVRYIVTDTGDGIEESLSDLKQAVYRTVTAKAYSHSKTREEEAFASTADIVVFVTQDVRIERDDWLEKLIDPIITGDCDASYSRQLCTEPIIERYIREQNYPEESITKTADSIPALGFNTFFFSDASCAICRDSFVRLNGYDGRRLPSNENMYFAYKLITNGYRIRYCSDSIVVHYHQYSLPNLFRRYYLSGQFLKAVPEMNQYNVSSSGRHRALHVWRRALQDQNYKALVRFLPDMAARYLGLKVGLLKCVPLPAIFQ